MALSLAIAFSESNANPTILGFSAFDNSSGIEQEDDDFKYGQYVYVTLKDGSETAAKIVGKKSMKKYYVKQLDGFHRGLAHKKYIRKMTKEEVMKFKSKKSGN
ncbi:hypothetical protein [Ekhidna sp.]|uniref:hypothetical protein n=1 Tax=Ekhidna sp. TaxID=2608089 RepID=UPI003298F293